MLRQLLSAIITSVLGKSSKALPHDPADPAFWVQLGHTETRAREIAECFPAYWQRLGSRHPNWAARYCYARQIGDLPLHWQTPRYPERAKPERLPETDPFMWCCVSGHDLYPLEQAIEYSVLAARKKGNRKLRTQREEWYQLYRSDNNYDRRILRFSENRTPDNPLFWRQLGHNPAHSRRLVRCCPEYWFRRSQCSCASRASGDARITPACRPIEYASSPVL